MKPYVSRRRCCWTLMTQIDPVTHVSERHRSDVLLDLSGLTREERGADLNEQMNVILTKLRMLSSFNIHVFTFEKVVSARRENAKTEANVETTQTLVGFRRKVNIVAVTNLEQVPFTQTPLKITVMTTTQSNWQMLIKHTTSEKKLWTAMTTRKTTRFLHMLLWMMSLFSRPDALLARTWNPGVSAHLVQASVQACFSFGKEKGKGKGKGKGKFPVRPSCMPLEDRRQRLRELIAKTECRACGRKGHWAHDRECAVSPSSLSSKTQTRTARMTTQLHLSLPNRRMSPRVSFSTIPAMTLKHSRTWLVKTYLSRRSQLDRLF